MCHLASTELLVLHWDGRVSCKAKKSASKASKFMGVWEFLRKTEHRFAVLGLLIHTTSSSFLGILIVPPVWEEVREDKALQIFLE